MDNMDNMDDSKIEKEDLMKSLFTPTIRNRFINAFGKLHCKFSGIDNFLENELKPSCRHPVNQTINEKHNELLIYVKNILTWLDSKTGSSAIKKKSSMIHINGKVTNVELLITDPNTDILAQGSSDKSKMNVTPTSINESNNSSNEENNSVHINEKTRKRSNLCSPDISKVKMLKSSPSSTSISDMVVSSEPEKSPKQNSVKMINSDYANKSKNKVLTNAAFRNAKGETCLHIHCAKGKLSEVTGILNNDASPNIKDNAGWTPLHEAVKCGNLEIVELLIKNGAFVNVPGFEYDTPLITAIKYEQSDVAKLLLQKGADSKCIDIYGCNAQSQNPDMWSKLSEFEMPHTSSEIEKNIPYTWNRMDIFLHNVSLNINIINRFCAEFNAKLIKKQMFKNKLKQITHIIVPVCENCTCKMCYEILMGIGNGICIVNVNWLVDSLADGRLKPCDNYEVQVMTSFGNYNSPKMSRLSKQNLIPKLFDGINIHLTGNTDWEKLSIDQLKDLAIEFGAKLLNRMPNPSDCPSNIIPYHCRDSEQMRYVSTIVLYTKDSNRLIKYNMRHLKVFHVSWFMEAVQKYKIV